MNNDEAIVVEHNTTDRIESLYDDIRSVEKRLGTVSALGTSGHFVRYLFTFLNWLVKTDRTRTEPTTYHHESFNSSSWISAVWDAANAWYATTTLWYAYYARYATPWDAAWCARNQLWRSSS